MTKRILTLAAIIGLMVLPALTFNVLADEPGMGPGGTFEGKEAFSIDAVSTETGYISLSIDGGGSNLSSDSIQVEKPVGATVGKAFFAAASNWYRDITLFGVSTVGSDKKEIRSEVGAEGPKLNPRGLPSEGAKSHGAKTPGYCPSYGGSIEYESIYDVTIVLNPGGTMMINVVIWIANPTGCTYGEPCPEYDDSPEYINAWIDWNGDEVWAASERVMDAALTGYQSINYYGTMTAVNQVTIPSAAVASPRMRVNLGWGYDPEVCDLSWDWGDVLDTTITTVAVIQLDASKNFPIRDDAGNDITNPIWKKQFNDKGQLEDVTPKEDDPVAVSKKKGSFKITTTLDGHPQKPTWDPKVEFQWSLGNQKGKGEFNAWSKEINIECPTKVGQYTLSLQFTIKNDKGNLVRNQTIQRKVYLTLDTSQISKPKEIWVDKATDWASSAEKPENVASLLNTNIFGKSGWNYAPNSAPDWKSLVEGSTSTGNCWSVANVWLNLGKVDGITGTTKMYNTKSFITVTPADAFGSPPKTGNIKHENAVNPDRWNFSMHTIGEFASPGNDYYDPTFGKTYANELDYIEWYRTAMTGADGALGRWRKYQNGNWVKLYYSGTRINRYWGPYTIAPELMFAGGPNPSPANNPLISMSQAQFTGNVIHAGVDTDSDGIYNYLSAQVELNIIEAGRFLMLASLEFDDTLFITDRSDCNVSVSPEYDFSADLGLDTVEVTFCGEDIYQKGYDGIYELNLLLMDSNFVELDTLRFFLTSYLHSQFGDVPARVTSCTDFGEDTEPDGYYDYLTVQASFHVERAMSYTAVAILTTDSSFICAAEDSFYLTVGNHVENLRLDGTEISRSQTDGPYLLDILLFDQDQNLISSLEDTTSTYSWTEFEKKSARITAIISESASDTNGNSFYDMLTLDCGLYVEIPGDYRVVGWLGSGTGDEISWADAWVTLGSGAQSASLNFPGTDIYSSGQDGPYLLSSLILYNDQEDLLDFKDSMYQTSAYSYSSFESPVPPLITLTGNYTSTAVDTNSNGLYDYLRVGVELISRDSGFVIINARLADTTGVEIMWSSSFHEVFADSTQGIPLDFEGREIWASMTDGPYEIGSLVAYHTGDPSGIAYEEVACTTASYPYTAFDRPPYVVGILLHPGWQWVSTNIDPDPSEMESLFVDCWDDLDIIIACDGSFCIPGVGCWIPGWNVSEMYRVHMADACTIQVCGSKVPTDTPIPLPAGWNCIAFFPEWPLEPETALVSIWDNLDIVKNDDGEFCIPGVGCWIECMEYNEGYKAHLSSPDTLVYPTSCPPCPPPFAKRNSFPGFAKTAHFNYLGNTGESYSIVVNSVELNGKQPEVGDEIGVFTPSGLCVGAGVWQGGILGIAAWQDDDRTEVVDGFQVGEQMVFKLWDKSENKEVKLSAIFEKGNEGFGTVADPASGGDAYALVNLKSVSESVSSQIPKQFELTQNYPNPFNPETKISYALPEDCHVKLTIYNIMGQKIKVLVDEHQTAGYKHVHWDGKDKDGKEVASGIYLYRIQADDISQTKKMVLMR